MSATVDEGLAAAGQLTQVESAIVVRRSKDGGSDADADHNKNDGDQYDEGDDDDGHGTHHGSHGDGAVDEAAAATANRSEHGGPTWAWAVRLGLQFGDPATEDAFLMTSLHSTSNLVFTGIIMLFYGVFSISTAALEAGFLAYHAQGLPWQLNFPYGVSVGMKFLAGFMFVGSVAMYTLSAGCCMSCRLLKPMRARVSPPKLTQLATGVALLAFVLFFLINFCDEEYLHTMFELAVQESMCVCWRLCCFCCC
jgi:hypothetical protein